MGVEQRLRDSQGQPLPKDFTYLYAPANRILLGSTQRLTPNLGAMLVSGDGTMPVRNISDFVARYTREFQLEEEHPNALGSVTLSDTGPFEAGSTSTWSRHGPSAPCPWWKVAG